MSDKNKSRFNFHVLYLTLFQTTVCLDLKNHTATILESEHTIILTYFYPKRISQKFLKTKV